MTFEQVQGWFVFKGYTGISSPAKFDKWTTEGLNEIEPPPPPQQELMTANAVYAYIAENYPT